MTENPTARLLDCGFCYEEQGEEVHPHPECPIGQVAAPAAVSVAGQTLLGAAEVETRPDLNVAPLTDDQLAAGEEVELTGQTALRDLIAAAMREHYLCTNRDEADADGNLPCRCGDWREPGAEVDDENDWHAHLADAVLAVLPPPADRAAALTEAERTMLAYALDQAQEHIWSRDGFTDEDQAAVTSLRRLAAEAPAPETQAARCLCGAPIEWMDVDVANGSGWVHSPGSDTPCLTAIPAGAAAPGQPQRGDEFEEWLKAQRDAAADYPEAYQAADGLLDLYRLHADTGTPLSEHVCEGQEVGDCECLEAPAAVSAGVQPDTEA
ncbi:hypothetical protein [Streptomyces sp. NBC_00140]|uniref:hypothetical protein n=1 Tax=Streptomyces sp. NBC_00140 TaxID=2975664 RepID=UPI0022549385|nr:hypothetical protein [Streptomyces sp. NBC_00140]MCX5336926.1 hypothetical protein [Streptomyces sp. NBC_00140]MCX5338409.1 hypothetical protein [Streptomyces sp. NBC_00140]